MINSTRSSLILFLFFIGSINVKAQGVNPVIAANLQNSLDSLCIIYQVKGISAAAFIPGQGLWKGVTGVSHGTVPIDTNMLLSIGSVTKTFIAAEIFKIIDDGLLSLDDSLHSLIGPHNYVDSNITVRQLLGHKTGLGDVTNSTWSAAMNADLYRLWYIPQVIDSFIDPPVGVPGTNWNYCNANYVLLGEIIEAKRNDSLHKVLRNELLIPNQLTNTYMEVFETYPNPVAHNWSTPTFDPTLAYDASGVPHTALWSSAEAAGGLFSDGADLAMWAYNLYSGNVISQASLNEMLTFTSVASSYYTGYGLGVMRYFRNGRAYYGHAGNYFGYAASTVYYPQDSISIGLLVNQDCISPNLALELINTLINELTLDVTDISVNHKNEMLIFSNPSNDEIKIEVMNSKNLVLEVFDLTGKKIYDVKTENNFATIPVSQFSSGLYLVKGENGANGKFIVSR